jgi:transcriptional regulator with XRE-family HTH domain
MSRTLLIVGRFSGDHVWPVLGVHRGLYSLDPMNVGTAEVESLTGYVARIAEAHCVTVSDLVGAELSDPASSSPLFNRHRGKDRSNFFYVQSYSVNGIADAPGRWVGVLEAATLRRGLSDLTLLTFADVFSESHLFRNVSAWCPSCFESRRRHGIRYESLLWTIEAVKVCPFHREPLEDICPHCRRRSRPLGAHARPGYCCRCRGWLGGAQKPAEKSINESDLEHEIWIAHSIGDLLAAAPNLRDSPLRERLCINLSTCIDAATGGNLLAFAAITRTSRCALRYWVSGVHRPEIGALLRLCYAIGVPIIQLLGDPASTRLDILPLRDDRGLQLRRHGDEVRTAMDRALTEDPPPSVSEVARRLHFARGERLYQIDRGRAELLALRHRDAIRALQPRPQAPRKCERPRMKRILEESLAREYPISTTEIAAQNGYANAGCIRLEFPDLCRAIGRKIAQLTKAEMNASGEIMKAALHEDPPPTASQLASRLGFSSPDVLARNFPTLYPALLERRNVHEKAKRKQLHSDLICALAQNPAPTVPAVCERLGISTTWVYCQHRDLARAIAARHLRQRAESMEQRSDILHSELFGIVKNMLDRGERPTRAHIRKMLSANSLKAWKRLGGIFNEATATQMTSQTEQVPE